jgi:MFS family permease
MTRVRLWLTASVTASLMLGIGLVAPLLPLLRKDLDMSGQDLGLVLAAFPTGRLLFAYAGGYVADRIGFRLLGSLACLVAMSGGLTAAWWFTPVGLAVGHFVMGAASISYTAGAAAHVLESAPPGRAGRSMSAYQTVTLVGASCGPTVGALAGTNLGLRGPFLIYAGLSLVGAIVTAKVIDARGGEPAAQDDGEMALTRDDRHEPRRRRRVYLLLGLAALGLFWSRSGPINTVLPIVAFEDLRMSVETIGYALTVAVGATVLVVPHAGRLADRGRSRPLMVGGSLGLAACLALLPVAGSPGQLFVLLVMFGAFAGYVLTGPQVLLVEWSPPGKRGRAVGLHRTASSLGMVLGPVTAGAALDGDRPDLLFVAGGVALALVAVALTALPTGGPARARQRATGRRTDDALTEGRP